MNGETENLQGVWSIVALVVEGRRMSSVAFSGAQIVMKGNWFDTAGMGGGYGGTFTVDGGATPKTLDLLFTDGPHAGKVSAAIYKLDDDCLTICVGFAGHDRPQDFVTTPGSGHALETLKRYSAESATAADDLSTLEKRPGEATISATARSAPSDGGVAMDSRAGEDMARLQGEWAMVSGEMDGQSLFAQEAATGKRVIKGSEVTVSFAGQLFLKASFTLDAGTSPKSMDYTLLAGPNKGRQQLGIYELEGDTLRICYTTPGAARPMEFSTSPGDGRTMAQWRRSS